MPSDAHGTSGTSTAPPPFVALAAARFSASSDHGAVAGLAATASHASVGWFRTHAGIISRRLSDSRSSSSWFRLAMLSGRPSLVSLFPASISLRMPTHAPMESGSASMTLSLRMSHPRRGDRDKAGTSRTLFALNDTMYSAGSWPRSSGRAVNSHPKQNRILSLVSCANEGGSALSGFLARFRYSSEDTWPISVGSSVRPQPPRSSRVTPDRAREPSLMAARTRLHRAAGVSPSWSAAAAFAAVAAVVIVIAAVAL
mmetsp:Transcript_7545/g.19197  ORF Transcript_7545/g.19197 Transcript_7545/m.19197 type:complete len:256 (+) Transcript_7545:218-985(+)